MVEFDTRLRNAQHVRRFTIQETNKGWEVKEEQDSRVVRQVCYTDWHRVERARKVFAVQVSDLRRRGWNLEH